ncbi:hypothetical protein AIOL_004837 [Candidatus Rhodobacter oscarellae]|uniref:Uncharacterized protein n=1 Tax=Candidatus Rhodobacter oscarellae TaxID=1675527 RepID=A0A0J9H2C2_9RHOB|nr:hypothetical protein AIOL_004837 [Candidatus Rhodobacter lobularis]
MEHALVARHILARDAVQDSVLAEAGKMGFKFCGVFLKRAHARSSIWVRGSTDAGARLSLAILRGI